MSYTGVFMRTKKVFTICIAAVIAVLLLVMIKNQQTNNQIEAVPSTTSRLLDSTPVVGDYQCQDKLCCEFLATEYEKMGFVKCSRRTDTTNRTCTELADIEPAVLGGHCHFMNGTGRAAVALASFPGSGNTWVRGLLERATGICTGAVYCDKVLRSLGFIGEHVTSGSVLVVKTHKTYNYLIGSPPTTESRGGFGSAILLIRNPINAVVANYNRRMTRKMESKNYSAGNRHVSSLGPTHFANNTEWKEYIMNDLSKWMKHVTAWARLSSKSSARSILVVRYEDLQTDTAGEVSRMLEFLAIPYRMDELRQSLSKDFVQFHRNHTNDFDPYTQEQKGIALKVIQKTLDTVKNVTGGNTFGLDKYL